MSESSDSLTEFMDAEFVVGQATSPADEEKLRSALGPMPGIVDLTIAHGRVDVRYDPMSVTKKEIAQRIEAAGYRISDVQTAPASPVTDMIVPS